jgi:predicted transcriptional regulator
MHSESPASAAKPFPFLQGIDGHHRAPIPRIAAQRRMDSVETVIEALPSRVRDIAIMRGLGYKLQEIAQHMGLTPQAVSIMLQRHRARIKELGVRTDHWELSTRAANVLGRLRVTTREEARARNVAAKLRGQRNCGEKTIREIERWLAEGTDG